jgi:hypothetical protein
MTKHERHCVTAALCKLATATVGLELDPDRIVVYLEQLDADPAEAVLAALSRLTRTARFFPAVGEIVAEMEVARGDLAERAWQTATRLTRADRNEIREAYVRDCRLEAAVRSMGGIAVIRDRTIRDDEHMRRKFAAAYRTADSPTPSALKGQAVTMPLRSSERPGPDSAIEQPHVPLMPGIGEDSAT